MVKNHGVVSQDTLIPISFAITIIGLAYWISNIAAIASQSRQDIEYLRDQRQKFDMVLSEKLDHQAEVMSEIRARVAAIDAKLATMQEMDTRK